MEFPRPRRLHAGVKIGHDAPCVGHGVQIGDTGQGLDDTDLFVLGSRAPLAPEAAHDPLIEECRLEEIHHVRIGKEIKNGLALVQLFVQTVGPINVESDVGPPALPAGIEEFAHECARWQKPLIPHIVAIGLSTESGIGTEHLAGHFGEIVGAGHGLIGYMRQHEILEDIQNVGLRESLGERHNVSRRRVLVVDRIGILNGGCQHIL